MRIKEVSGQLVLYRYGGYVASTKTQLEVKIGNLPASTEPVLQGTDGKNTNGISQAIWDNLTGVEQRELIEFLTVKRQAALRAGLASFASGLVELSGSIDSKTMDSNLATQLWFAIEMTGRELKAAGFPKASKIKAVEALSPAAKLPTAVA